MSSNLRDKRIRAARELVMERQELRYPSSPRQSPTGPTSMPVKQQRDAETVRIITEYERKARA